MSEKRPREEGDGIPTENEPQAVTTDVVLNSHGRPKGEVTHYHQVALLIAYIGTGFRGLQVQPHCDDTIDNAMLVALHKAGLIPTPSHKECYYHRSCRTDKGVHALRNVVSVRLQRSVYDVENPQTEAFVAKVNEGLPENVRLMTMVHVMASFRARENCSRRRYQYVFPVYALDPAADEAKDLVTPMSRERAIELGRIFNSHAKKYLGVQRYHNYVGEGVKITASSGESQRLIYQCELLTENDATDTPLVFEMPTDDNNFYVVFRIEAQSFLLNMIRKIVGVCICLCRGTESTLQDHSLDASKEVITPMAPGSNLYLHTPFFHAYDREDSRIRSLKTNAAGVPNYVPLQDAWKGRQEFLDSFERKIWMEVGSIEKATSSMTKFLRMNRMHNWCVRDAKK